MPEARLKLQGLRAVLFDLDGTLADSAPDLGGAANEMRLARGLPALPLASYRRHCGSGARGMLRVALDRTPEHGDFDDLKREFLARYGVRLLHETTIFSGVKGVLEALSVAGLRWGVVTNKTLSLARPLCEGLGLHPHVLVGGDCTLYRKPHPAPLLEAARHLGVAAADCIYVGDDPRDVIAGRAAGMSTAAALWGYLGVERPPAEWGADHQLAEITSLLRLLQVA